MTADWSQVGALLGEARRRKRLSKRAAARAAGVADITWRQLESGRKQVEKGLFLDPSPRDETLLACARAVGAEVSEVFAAAGRPAPPDTEPAVDWGQELDQLHPEDRAQVQSLIERLRQG